MKKLPWKGRGQGQVTRLQFYTPCNISATANARDFKFCTWVGHAKSKSRDQWVFPISSRGQGYLSNFYIVDLENFATASRRYTGDIHKLVSGRFVYYTYRTMKATRSRHGWVHMFITHCPTVTLQLHNFDLFRTCRTSSFCTVAWQLLRFQLTRRIARSLGDSWASCHQMFVHVTDGCGSVLLSGVAVNYLLPFL